MGKTKLQQLFETKVTRKEFLIYSGIGLASLLGIAGALKQILTLATTQTADKEAEAGTISSAAAIVNDTAGSGSKAVKFGSGTSTGGGGGGLLGIYHGGPTTDDAVKTTFGAYPQIASTYYTYNQQSLNIAQETARINKGISPLVTLAAAKADGSVTYIADLADSTSSGHAAAITWITTYVNNLKTLSEVDPNVTVYAGFTHEFTSWQASGGVTGASADAANYGKAHSIFCQLARQNAPKVKTVFWTAAFDATSNTALANMTSFPHIISADPYSIKPQTPGTPASTWSTFINSLRNSSGAYHTQYVRMGSPPLAISETGVAKWNKLQGVQANTDQDMATWYNRIRSDMDSNDLEFVVFFNRDSGGRANFCITTDDGLGDGNHPLSITAFGNQLKNV